MRFTDHFKIINPFKLKNISEKEYSRFDPSILEAGDNILLEGFFPSYKYFEDIREVLIKDFLPKQDMNVTNKHSLDKIQNTNSVGVHFRRGDYALTGHHGMLTKDYYEAAIKQIALKAGPVQLFIFSDEPDWVKENMQFEFLFDVISFNKDEDSYFDMELMKHCKHNIIANSSFSWWGAWLNENPDKIVIAPKKWLNLEVDSMENIPDEWILL
ncbi:alpha-1,2-fucosyltransferase [Ferruginibacter sp.]|uniref:alpha-1,2-fucosyltransferase n=1 Tax=Ferruginibacter sp. TaxID=1940288 RepID=UPI002659C6ED|nr:alpha-1,2-fucosyltransferase [Ferruginibacter sp.]